MKQYDVIVIGSGPGGYVCAIKAAQYGLKVGIVEKESLGGVCLNWGCIPTKSLLHSAAVYSSIKQAQKYGFDLSVNGIDIVKIVENSRSAVHKLTNGVEMLLKKNKIDIIRGVAKLVDKTHVAVLSKESMEQKVEAKHIVIGTGAKARQLPNIAIDEEVVCTARGAMTPKSLPKHVVIIGGGVIGVEFASFYQQMGSKVTILEIADDILKTEDLEIRTRFKNSIITNGVNINTSIKITSIVNNNSTVCIQYVDSNKTEQEVVCDKLIQSIGIIPNINGIGLEECNIEVEKNYIKTNAMCQTNVTNIYAIGDVTSGPWLAHKASHEGIVAANHIAYISGLTKQKPHGINKNTIPSCIYSNPQIASIGITEEIAKEQKMDYKIGKFSAIGNGKAIASHDDISFVKIITDNKTGEILGAHLIGYGVTELISGIAVGKTAELIDEDFIQTIFPHPTISEMIHEAMLDTNKQAIHK